MKDLIRKTIREVLEKLYPEHKDIVFDVDFPPAGVDADFASNVAMVLAKKLGKKPMEVAEKIRDLLFVSPPHEEGKGEVIVDIAPPGFLNFKLPSSVWQKELAKILKEGKKYGTSKINKGKKARVEYVSANPTGPVHIGNVRGGPYGKVICNALEATGWKVLREYYHNDVGGQVEKLGKTIWYWYEKLRGKETEFPEGGYPGEYPKEAAEEAVKKLGSKFAPSDQAKLTNFALEYIFKENIETLKRLGIEFDQIISESKLQKSGKTAKAIEEIKKKGFAQEKEGALWFAHPLLNLPLTPPIRRAGKGEKEGGADREAVIVKSNGQPTYFASDIAYHKEKFTSGYNLVMDIFGSNHHGHVPKLQALTKIYGFDTEKFKVLLYQYVRVKRGQEVVKMAKRAGNFITAKEVLDEVGKDSMIFMLLMTAVNTHVDFDLELAKDTSEKNPVFRVQYAHARIESVERKAESVKIGKTNLALLAEREELALIRELAKFPEMVADIAETYNVHHLPHYLLGLADKFHQFYEKVRVITDNEEETAAKLALVRAVQQVLANGLQLMGIKPMEKM